MTVVVRIVQCGDIITFFRIAMCMFRKEKALFTIELSGRMPIYEQLKSQIIRLAVSGVLSPNEQIPSVRTLAQQLRVNPNTVQKAYQELERTGVIYSFPGKGSFVSEDILDNEPIRHDALNGLKKAAKTCLQYGVTYEMVMQSIQKIYEGGNASDSNK